jgi:RNA polymerase sigma factor (sigma-70 family)
MVILARDGEEDSKTAAFNSLCQGYWFPIYSFCRAQGLAKAEAEDATQSFFLKLISQNGLKRVTAVNGRFRSFLLTCIKNHLIDLHHHAHAQRRGGDAQHISLDFIAAEKFLSLSGESADSPDLAYDRQWARIIVDRALLLLANDYESRSESRIYALLNAQENTSHGGALKYTEIGQTLGINEDAVKYQARLLKKRFLTILRTEIARTVDTPAEVDDELRYILSIIR